MKLIILFLPLVLCGCSLDPVKDGAEITRIKTRAEIVKERNDTWQRIASQQSAKRQNK